jgi:hypothetical protein
MFEMEGIYEFTSGDETLIIQFLEEHHNLYECKIIGGTAVPRTDWGCMRNVYKSSRILKNWKCKQLDGESAVEVKSSGVVSKKRRTPAEIQMDNFIESCLSKRRIEVLKVEIDEALISGDRTEFLKLSKELQKLQKKVTA